MRRLLFLALTALLTIFISACSDSGTGPETTTYTVTIDASPSDAGSILPSADSTYDDGEEIELQASPDEEYVFVGWTGDVESDDNPHALTVDQDYAITVNFERKSYELTVNKEGDGEVNEKVLEQQSKEYEHGTIVELTASPAEGYKFVEWKGDVTGTDNPTQITVDNPKEVTAVFEKKSYALTVNTDGKGTVDKSPDQAEYEYGTTVELTASLAPAFDEWQGDAAGTNNPIEVTVDGPKEITAAFNDFYVAENGVTVKCPAAEVGDTGTIDGTPYTKRTADQIAPDNAEKTCTSGITDMSGLFESADSFSGDISSWDVSNVKSMKNMFAGAQDFNRDLSSWDVSSVTDMSRMFNLALAFDRDLSNWNVSNVTDMSRMFLSAFSFNGDISSWDVSNVINMEEMFRYAESFDRDLSSWNVSSVTDMSNMFQGAEVFNRDLSSWDVSSVLFMDRMFRDASVFNQNLSGWCVSEIDSEPTEFATNSALTSGNKPDWGNCP